MNNIAEIRQNVDDFEKFKNGIKKFFDKVDEMGQEVSTINNHFSFLSKYGYKASCGFGKGKLSYKPFVVFMRIDSGYDSASKGVYCRVNILRGTDNVSVEINESETNKIQYKAQQDCNQYNKDKPCEFKRNNLDGIVEQVLKDMEWFANLPLDSIKDNATTTAKPQNDENSQPDINKNKGDTMDNKTTIPPLNQILYGPPGTGKTYSTIDKALEILRHYDKTIEIPESREDKRKIFDKYRANKQIEFVTFHQSFSYEEFVEGIKPNVENKNAEMTYEVKDGIFKDISERALSNYQAYKDSLATLPQQQISTKELFQAFAQNLQEQLASAENGIDFNTPSLSTKMRISKIFYLKNEEAKSIYISVPNAESGQTLKRDIVLRDYEKFKSGEISNYKDIKPTYESLAQWHGNAIYYFALYEKLAEFEKTYKPQTQSVDKVALKPYILIIDEINRGNISKILGELITLIEPSKRIGASDEEKTRGIGNESLEVTLPYSNETFGVPSNLYIIGTMNTADRSIALLDTALRRRFEFVEMMPNCKELQKIWLVENDEDYENSSIDEWNAKEAKVLYEILTAINNRIEFLLDREHTIGHAFFFEKAIREDGYFVLSLDSLKEIFAKKIIPLLQEYFYDDYAKIQAVLNDNGMIKSKPKPEFLSKFSDEVNDEKVVYEIEKEWQKWESWQFVKIYNSRATKSQSQDFGESNEDE